MSRLRSLVKYTGLTLFIFAASQRGLHAEPPLVSPKCNEFTFDATRSEYPLSPDISFLWDFGDGMTSKDPVVTHRYLQSGDFTVSLRINDKSGAVCSEAVTTQTVRVNIPPRASFISEDRACVDEQLTFDASLSSADGAKRLAYAWQFGDGETREGSVLVTKAYQKGGDYLVRLRVDDQSGTLCSSQTAEKIVHINEPPKAEAGENEILRCVEQGEGMTVHFDASASTDANNDPLSYIWDFGDGQKAKGARADHHYERPGQYDARLVVSDGTGVRCGTGVDFVTVRINEAPRAVAGDDITACVDEDVTFDGSGSYISKKGTAVAQWAFGDGATHKGLYATHRYSRPGTYRATLSLDNMLNTVCPTSRDTRNIAINAPPSTFIEGASLTCVGREMFFDASSSNDTDGDELVYHWTFGDGTARQDGSKVRHAFVQGGDYRVSVVVDDQKGTACSTATANVKVSVNTPPRADAGKNLVCCAGKEALFSAAASSDPDGDRLTYTWDFGDGTSAEGERATHTYAHAGSYNVRLTVDDHSGTPCSRSTDGFTAVVRDVIVPRINIR